MDPLKDTTQAVLNSSNVRPMPNSPVSIQSAATPAGPSDQDLNRLLTGAEFLPFVPQQVPMSANAAPVSGELSIRQAGTRGPSSPMQGIARGESRSTRLNDLALLQRRRDVVPVPAPSSGLPLPTYLGDTRIGGTVPRTLANRQFGDLLPGLLAPRGAGGNAYYSGLPEGAIVLGSMPSLDGNSQSSGAGLMFDIWDDSPVLGKKRTGKGVSETRGEAFSGGAVPTHPGTLPAFGGVVAFRWKIPDTSIPDGCYYTYVNFVTRSVRWNAYWGTGSEPKWEATYLKESTKRHLDNEGENGVDPTKPESPLAKSGAYGGTVAKIDLPNMDNDFAKSIAQAVAPRVPLASKICVYVTWLLEAWLVLVCKGNEEFVFPVNRTTATVRGFACFMTNTWRLLQTGSTLAGGDDTTEGKDLTDGDKAGFDAEMDHYAPPWGKVKWAR